MKGKVPLRREVVNTRLLMPDGQIDSGWLPLLQGYVSV